MEEFGRRMRSVKVAKQQKVQVALGIGSCILAYYVQVRPLSPAERAPVF